MNLDPAYPWMLALLIAAVIFFPEMKDWFIDRWFNSAKTTNETPEAIAPVVVVVLDKSTLEAQKVATVNEITVPCAVLKPAGEYPKYKGLNVEYFYNTHVNPTTRKP